MLRIPGLTRKVKQPEPEPAVREQPMVLLLDDDNSILTILNAVLTKAGFECHEARDGVAGFDMACQLLPDLMIIDVNMPNRNGFEVLRMLRQNPPTATIRTMMLTANEQEAGSLRGFVLGTNEYVTKPFDPMEIAARAKALLAKP